MRNVGLCLVLILTAMAAAAAESPVNISGVETKDLKLYYYNYLDFLEPHSVRAYVTGLRKKGSTIAFEPRRDGTKAYRLTSLAAVPTNG